MIRISMADVGADFGLETITSLGDVYPNPLRDEAVIAYTLGERSKVDLAIYNMIGQRVSTLVNSTLDQGSYRATWNRTNHNNELVMPGVYLVKMQTGSKIFIKRIEVVR